MIFLWLSVWVTLLLELVPNSGFTPVHLFLSACLCGWVPASVLCNSPSSTCVCVSVRQCRLQAEKFPKKNLFIVYSQSSRGFLVCVMFVWFLLLCRNWRLLPTFAFQLVALLGVCSHVIGFPSVCETHGHVQFMSSMWSQVLWLVRKCLFNTFPLYERSPNAVPISASVAVWTVNMKTFLDLDEC